ncbi:MAG: GatB/YqeY domain-containing protein [Verrucomicrobia bacterium]|nr:GatB/YqeY domain-containing protein [Verrucomicrobiota bacterium]
MSLNDRIANDLKEAMKAREMDRLNTIRMLKSAVKMAAIEKGGADAVLTDAEIEAVVRKQVKQRRDAVDGFEKGGRPELAAKEKQEIEVLGAYLPKELTDAELGALIDAAIAEVGATGKAQLGAVMKAVQPKVAGRADGKRVSAEVGRRLA